MTKKDETIARLKEALLSTGMMNNLFVEWIAEGHVDDEYVRDAFHNLRREQNHDLYEVERKYVLGFVFSFDFKHVLLIWKNRPAWQKGKLNGIGGKIEPRDGAQAVTAMYREFWEETAFIGVGDEVFTDNPVPWIPVGERIKQANYDFEPGSYRMHIFAATFWPHACDAFNYEHNYRSGKIPGKVIWDLEKIPEIVESGEHVIVLPYNLEIINKYGVPGLAGLLETCKSALIEGFNFRLEDL